MSNWISLIKKGNTSSATAALGNTGLAIIKAIAASISGSGTMFASAMHSVADAINQGFVFIGSVLAERKPTEKFPTGFGRVVNLFCMIAVIVVTIMAYETFLKGIKLLKHPEEATNFWLNFIVLMIAIIIDGTILLKAMKEIIKETRADAKGLGIVSSAFRNAGRAAPPTRLVFYEDIVATLGAIFALLAVILAEFTSFKLMDGIATVLIACLMIGVAFKVGYDNMVGLIGVAAPKDVEERIGSLILNDPDVTDIGQMRIVQEGRNYHVEAYVELRKGFSLAEATEINLRIRTKLIADSDVADVTLGIMDDNGIVTWKRK
ncbi:cation diffusion facilitator family transporter [Paenibacillus sp. GSMTC-2017]|uniref:cation diffusion facilitator family transporter n=1 Tax=Paenibacillus sp. GSMTC-2017 TaxID=2794350 RepID=UPI0018D62501|nr:cation diffusion facilitator family transporter [Paenibacillus sp. GSMTC-2017]MBH5317707.1 cation diffusion facilitator family transporter [Paenibacillus sp. GSMTC-2017]